MSKDEVSAYFRLTTLCFLVLIVVTQCNYQNDTMAAIRAVGIQCNVDYTIELPEIENIKPEGE